MHDLVIVGAGPAGMAAAIAAADRGLDIVVLDEATGPGGQIYRNVLKSTDRDRALLGSDYAAGRTLAERFMSVRADYRPRSAVFMLERADQTHTTYFIENGSGRSLRSRAVLLATGALERPAPFPGWTLPGVMTVGAAQTLLKADHLVPQGRVAIAGSGPLMYLLAAQYANAGIRIAALLDMTPRPAASLLSALPAFLISRYAAKGIALLSQARRAGSYVRGVTALAALGRDRLEAIEYTTARQTRRLDVDTLLMHQGIVPQINLLSAAGAGLAWSPTRLAFEPILSPDGATSVPGLFVAGDAGGIAGAAAAEYMGTVVGLAIAHRLRPGSNNHALHAKKAKSKLSASRRGRAFIDGLYRPARAILQPADETIVCRCERITAGTIRALAQQGATGPNQIKALCRAGMGPCQGRQCALTVTGIIAEVLNATPAEIGHMRLRAPVRPVTLGMMADIDRAEP